MLKFLKEEEITRTSEDGKISITINQLSTSRQTRVMSMARFSDIEGQIALLHYLLASAIVKVVIDLVEYEPKSLINTLDVTHDDTKLVAIQMLGEAQVDR